MTRTVLCGRLLAFENGEQKRPVVGHRISFKHCEKKNFSSSSQRLSRARNAITRFRVSVLSFQNKSILWGQSFFDRRDSWFFCLCRVPACHFCSSACVEAAIFSYTNSIFRASGPTQRHEVFASAHKESSSSSLVLFLFETFVLRAAPMKNWGTAHLNQFWCHANSKRIFFWGRDAVALVDLDSLMFECCMVKYDATCASEMMGEERTTTEERIMS